MGGIKYYVWGEAGQGEGEIECWDGRVQSGKLKRTHWIWIDGLIQTDGWIVMDGWMHDEWTDMDAYMDRWADGYG